MHKIRKMHFGANSKLSPTVMEFIGIHDIPYIFLFLDEPSHISLMDFLASPDQFCNISSFVPNASFP